MLKLGKKIARAHLVHLNPFPKNLSEILNRYETVLIPEMNTGQLAMVIRSTFLKDVVQLNKIQGIPFKVSEIKAALISLLDGGQLLLK